MSVGCLAGLSVAELVANLGSKKVVQLAFLKVEEKADPSAGYWELSALVLDSALVRQKV